MKFTLRPIALAAVAAGLFSFLTPALQALEVDVKLNLKYYVQQKSFSSPKVVTGDVDSFRVDSKQLREMITKRAGINASGESELKMNEEGNIFIVDPKGGRRFNVSEFFRADFDASQQIFDGKRDLEQDKEEGTRYLPMVFTIDLPELKGSFRGLVIDNFKTTAPNKDGIRFTTANSKTQVNGSGKFEGKSAFIEGKVILKGREASVAR